MRKTEFERNTSQLINQQIILAAQDFNCTTKMNRAAGFQYGKIESELGSIIAKIEDNKGREHQIDQLEKKLDDLLIDLDNMFENVQKLDSYSKKLEEAIKNT